MTQLATAIITGAAAMLLGYRLVRKQAERQAEFVRAASTARARTGRVQRDLGTLVWDERSGVYRPR